jgi:hypothetical protein
MLPWVDAKREFEISYWKELIAKTEGDMADMVRLSGQYRPSIHKILARNGIVRQTFRHYCNRVGNWAQHGL